MTSPHTDWMVLGGIRELMVRFSLMVAAVDRAILSGHVIHVFPLGREFERKEDFSLQRKLPLPQELYE